MNNIKVKSRSRLGNTHLDHLMRIKLYLNAGRTVDLHKGYTMWKERKNQASKDLKSLSFECINKFCVRLKFCDLLYVFEFT